MPAGRCSASASGCSGCSPAAPKPPTCPASACARAMCDAAAGRRAGHRRAPEGAARRLEHAGAAAPSRLFAGVADRLARLLHALVSRRRSRAAPCHEQLRAWSSPPPWRTGSCRACSSIPRSPAQVGLQVLRNWVLERCANARQAHHRVPRRARRPGREGRAVRGTARPPAIPRTLARRYDVEGIDEVVILDVTATLEARQARAQTIQRRGARAVPAALRGRRHPHRGRRGGGDRRGRRQGEPQLRGAGRSVAHHAAGGALRQSGGGGGHRREAASTALDRVHPQRVGAVHARRDVVEWAREAAALRRRRDPAHVDGSRRHQGRLRLRAHRRRVGCGGDSGDCVRRRRRRSSTSPRCSPQGRADAALAASIFHFNTHGVAELKQYLAAAASPSVCNGACHGVADSATTTSQSCQIRHVADSAASRVVSVTVPETYASAVLNSASSRDQARSASFSL